jgi:hypothetical protein
VVENTEEKQHNLRERMKIIYSNPEDMLDGLVTAVGISACLTEFVAERFAKRIEEIPRIVRYSMALTAGNMRALLSDHPPESIEKQKFPLLRYLEVEQIEEHFRRKFDMVIRILYESLIEEEKENANN